MQYTASEHMKLGPQRSTAMSTVRRLIQAVIDKIGFISPLFDLGIRLYIANVFFKAGLTKISNWQSTLSLFEYEYAVPLLPSNIAAYLGTATELTIPVLLALGLGSRGAALILFVFNYIASISYPDLSEAGRNEHMYWGLLMLVTLFHGPGKLSLDHWIRRKFWRS